MLLLFTVFLRRVPAYLPIMLRIYTGPLLFAAGYLEDVCKYALVYVGLTGEGFWVSACRARALVSGAENGSRRSRRNVRAAYVSPGKFGLETGNKPGLDRATTTVGEMDFLKLTPGNKVRCNLHGLCRFH